MHKGLFQNFRFLLTLTFAALMSCAGRQQSLHILTDRKELAPVIEIYNAAGEDLTVTMKYTDEITLTAVEKENPDLIIGSSLSSARMTEILRPWEQDFPVYESLRHSPELVPLSFELPLIISRRGSDHSMVIRSEELLTRSQEFTETGRNGRLVRSGFSPAWNPLSYTDFLTILDPEAFSGGVEQADPFAMSDAVGEIQNWIVRNSGTVEEDSTFSQRYRYIPDEVLILDGRIMFARIDFRYWASLPQTVVDQLEMAYFSGPQTIPVTAVVSAGITKKSKSEDQAVRFVQWLTEPSTQARLMKRWEQDGIRVFGFLGGLSSVPQVNESALIEQFPEMERMIPGNELLSVPSSRPYRWLRIRDEVVQPWFHSRMSDGTAGPLAEAYRKWDLSSLEEND